MEEKNLLQDSKAYYEDNDYYEIFSIAEDGEGKVADYLKKITKDKIVLDAGCGTGKFLPVIEKESKKYIGIDLSQEQINKAMRKQKKMSTEFICSNLSKIKIEDETIDIVIATWVLGTIIDIKEREKSLNELKRVLKKDGKIILVENDLGGYFEEIRDRNKDNRTRDYNNWIVDNGFNVAKKIKTYFDFKTYKDAKKCFDIIYGDTVADRINDKKIEHNIIIFEYKK